MTNARNRRRSGNLVSRLTTSITRMIRRPADKVDTVVPGPGSTAKRQSSKRVKVASATGSRANRRRENPILVVLLWLLPMVAAVAAFATPVLGARAYEYLMSTGHFMVREVIVTGADQIERPEIMELAGIRPGTHILASDLGAMLSSASGVPMASMGRPASRVVNLASGPASRP